MSAAQGAGPGPGNPRAAAWMRFASMMLVLSGGFDVLWGIGALTRADDVLRPARANLVDVDYAVAGWVGIALGAGVLVLGLLVRRGSFAACRVAIWVAALSAIGNLLELGGAPLWSAIIIALDVLVIWAISVHGPEIMEDPGPPRGIVRTAGDPR